MLLAVRCAAGGDAFEACNHVLRCCGNVLVVLGAQGYLTPGKLPSFHVGKLLPQAPLYSTERLYSWRHACMYALLQAPGGHARVSLSQTGFVRQVLGDNTVAIGAACHMVISTMHNAFVIPLHSTSTANTRVPR